MHGNGILNHREALNNMLNNKIKRGYENHETIVHTDQGIIYSSVSFNNMFNSYKVTRSMSRAGTPTDNPVIESKNGWIKKEMYIDFDINNYNTVQEFIDDIVWDILLEKVNATFPIIFLKVAFSHRISFNNT